MINLHKDFLRDIFRVFCILNYAYGGVVNHILPGINNCFKSRLVAFFQLFYKRPFIQTRAVVSTILRKKSVLTTASSFPVHSWLCLSKIFKVICKSQHEILLQYPVLYILYIICCYFPTDTLILLQQDQTRTALIRPPCFSEIFSRSRHSKARNFD